MLYTIQTALTSSIQFCKNISILFFKNPQNLKQFREIESPGADQRLQELLRYFENQTGEKLRGTEWPREAEDANPGICKSFD